MILIRDVFQLKFGKAREAKALAREIQSLESSSTPRSTARYLTDLTGPYYTFVMERAYENLAAFEQTSAAIMAKKEFSDWYQKFIPLVESGRREIFSIVE